MTHRRRRFPHFGFVLTVGILAILAALLVYAFKTGDRSRRDGQIKAGLVNIRQEAEILADGGSYDIVCRDDNGTGIGLPVGIPQRNKIGQIVQLIVDNSPDPSTDQPVCSVSLVGDSIAISGRLSTGWWCVDSRGREGFGSTKAFSGACSLESR
jgi:hypothetical protein